MHTELLAKMLTGRWLCGGCSGRKRDSD